MADVTVTVSSPHDAFELQYAKAEPRGGPRKIPELQYAKAKLQYAKAELHYAKAELQYAKAELQYKNATNASQDRDARVEAERKLWTAHKRRAWRKLLTANAKAADTKPKAMKA